MVVEILYYIHYKIWCTEVWFQEPSRMYVQRITLISPNFISLFCVSIFCVPVHEDFSSFFASVCFVHGFTRWHSGIQSTSSPRFIDRQSQQQRKARLERRRATYERQSQQQRDGNLQRRREKRDSMTKVEKYAILEKRPNAYRVRKSRIGCRNTEETSDQASVQVSN